VLEKHYGVQISCTLPNPDRYLITARFGNKTPVSILEGINIKLHLDYGTDENILFLSKETNENEP
jgi:hypothetical protein